MYVFTDGKRFLIVGKDGLHRTSNIDNASYWCGKKKALSWVRSINKKYPDMEIKKIGFRILS